MEIEWSGSAPHCASGDNHAGCASGYPEYLTDSVDGQGGESVCYKGKIRIFSRSSTKITGILPTPFSRDEKFVLYRSRSLSELLMI